MDLKGVTPLERKVFDLLMTSLSKRGYSPSYREIQGKLGKRSVSGVHRVVWSLERKGWIKVNKHLSRSLLPTERALQFCERITSATSPPKPRSKAHL